MATIKVMIMIMMMIEMITTIMAIMVKNVGGMRMTLMSPIIRNILLPAP